MSAVGQAVCRGAHLVARDGHSVLRGGQLVGVGGQLVTDAGQKVGARGDIVGPAMGKGLAPAKLSNAGDTSLAGSVAVWLKSSSDDWKSPTAIESVRA